MAVLPDNQFSIIAGASGSGKTTLILQSWLEHTKGNTEWPLRFPSRAKTAAYVAADRTVDEAIERANYLGLKNIRFYGLNDDQRINRDLYRQPKDLWEYTIDQFDFEYEVLILDPMALYMEGNLNDFRCVAVSCATFGSRCKRLNKTILGVHHTTKPRSDVGFKRAQDRLSGSGAFAGYSSTQFMLIEGLEDDKEYDTLVAVPHMTPREETQLRRRPDGYFMVTRIEAERALKTVLQQSGYMLVREAINMAITAGMTDQMAENLINDRSKYVIEGDFLKEVRVC